MPTQAELVAAAPDHPVYIQLFYRWAMLTPNGLTVRPRCAALRYSDPRIRVVVGPINERATSEQIIRHAPEFDIFIDDGSHTSADINATFYNYFHRVRPGGLFVIEDLHCAYFPAYGGGLDAPGGSMGFLRVLADAIHKDYWQEKISLAERVAPSRLLPLLVSLLAIALGFILLGLIVLARAH